jgi:hypothetical protein
VGCIRNSDKQRGGKWPGCEQRAEALSQRQWPCMNVVLVKERMHLKLASAKTTCRSAQEQGGSTPV